MKRVTGNLRSDVPSGGDPGMEVKTIAVIGAGTMGRGIAYAAAFGGFNTVLEDVSRHVLEQGLAWIRQSFEEGVARGKVDASARDKALSLITTASTVEEAIRDADLVIEAVPEELEMKLELFTIFDKFGKAGAIFASNTSSLSITDFTDITVSRDRERRSIAREDGSGLAEFVENREEFELHLQFFRDGFNDKVGVADGLFDRACSSDQGKCFISSAGIDFAAGNSFFEGLANPGQALFEHVPRNVFEDGIEAAECRGVRNSPPHRARPNHCNGLHFHSGISPRGNITSQVSGNPLHQNRVGFASRG